jgi:hypothetical protein
MPYMEKRKDGWLWVQRRVPRDLVPILKRQWLRENTRTRDVAEYNRRSLAIIAKHDTLLASSEVISKIKPIIDVDGEVYPVSYRLFGVAMGSLITDDPQFPMPAVAVVSGYPPPEAVPVYRNRDNIILGWRFPGDPIPDSDPRINEKITHCTSQLRDPLVDMIPMSRDGKTIRAYLFLEPGEDAPLAPQAHQPVEFTDIIDLWAAERSVRPDSRRSATAHIRRLTDFLGHTDMARVSKDDIVHFRGALLKSGKITERTVANHLITIRTLFNFAVANGKIVSNPAKGVGLKAKADTPVEPQSLPL